jgi:hypothetical protein
VRWMCFRLSAHVHTYTTQGTTTGTHRTTRYFRFSQRCCRKWWRSILALLVRDVSTDRRASILTAVLTRTVTQLQTPEDSNLHSMLTQNCFYAKTDVSAANQHIAKEKLTVVLSGNTYGYTV